MRSKDVGCIPNIAREFPADVTLAMYRRMCIARNFEWNVKSAYDAQRIKSPIYLSLGQESIAAALSVVYKDPSIFAQHRCHDIYLSYGGDAVALVDELLGRSTGCAKGMGGSASIHDPTIGMFGHDGLMGNQIPIAVGFALGSGKRTLAIMGDASAEEDYVSTAMGYAATKRLPILFVCADNGLSILTDVKTRRNWSMADLATAFGMQAVEITDDPWLIMYHAQKLQGALPAFMNIHTVRVLWHAGTGTDGEPEWDRYALVQEELKRLGLSDHAKKIEEETAEYVRALWERQLTTTPA